jgi:hypothetical protein
MLFQVPTIKRNLDRWIFSAGPADTLVGWIFLRCLALIYLAAFASLSVQIEGLVGSQGILPIQAKLAETAQPYGSDKYWLAPTLFWLDASDPALKLACYAGIVSSLLLLLNVLLRPALMLCYLLYLSLTVAGQDFLSFQWDVFLLEAGFLGIFLSWGSGFVVFLYRWLIARFMFMGGVVKLASGDPAWAGMTALNYHYLTQPLPTPLAYYAYFLPEWFHKLCVAGVFFIELIVPFFVFMPRPFRLFAAGSFILLQTAIILTGNYNFFNLLTILLCLWLLDDKYFSGRLPPRLIAAIQAKPPSPGRAAHLLAGAWTAFVLVVCAATAWMHNFPERTPQPLRAAVIVASSFGMINQYGPFGVMTTERREIIVEGSNDGKAWQAYEFDYKPGDLFRGLRWNIPHQPRLDWQMWFAALEKPRHDAWFPAFVARLQEGSPPVLDLLRTTPFPDRPPRFVRAMLYRYDYVAPEIRAETGQVWRREPIGQYWPPPPEPL